ncbi:MAG: C40 family peptidase [Ignavibacteria bacterium]|jgi:cell wall-associated NlpC family hydrolase|nr:C40 family peptidase [Ignavibacteria bacterium]MCU7502474.1 C40 family peptidase [Ignavibacteria bacterium]MCU7514961.1 C40 family peptidase [Ignavibacteria bacterium]
MIIEKLLKILLLGTILAFVVGCSPSSYAQRYKSGKKHKSTLTSNKKSKKKSSSKGNSSKKNSSGKNSSKKNSSKEKLPSTPRYNPDYRTAVDDTLDESNDEISDEEDGEDLPTEKDLISVSQLVEKYVTGNEYAEPSDSVNLKEKVIMEIIKYLDTPYKFGGVTSKGIDCSAFTRTVYNNTFSYELPRTAREQFQQGEEVDDISRLKFGDLIFFNTRRSVKPGHVGIYLGDNLFAHSSSRQGVMVSSLNMEYYNKRFMGGRRFENLTVK